MSNPISNPLLSVTGVRYPVLCGAMYPCSNPELVAAASEAGGIGIVQPLSLTFAHGEDYRAGLKKIRALTSQPWGLNILTEQSSKIYLERMRRYLEISLEEGCRFFVTALGNPRWIVDRVKPLGGTVYHDVTDVKWAQKALQAGVDGFICVNNRAGGHAGTLSPEVLFETIAPLGKPLICAGGIGSPEDAARVIRLGYAGVQLGTRFIASTECSAHDDYKQAILKAHASDIVLTERLTGVPVSIIKTEAVAREGTEAGWLAKKLLQHRKLKHYARLWYSLKSFHTLKHASKRGSAYQDYWQAGKSVDGIDSILPAGEIMRRFGEACLKAK